MLFTTAIFVGAFLPIVLLGFFALGRRSATGAALWLFAGSIFFYGYWMPAFTLLLLGSIVFNFSIGLCIARARYRSSAATLWLTLGIVVNLGLLSYFKYANFLIDNLNAALGLQWHLASITLPIGISFYTFTQIAFLVDSWQGKVNEVRPIHYGLFVTYFPHLVAGPILHHAQMMPQFANPSVYRFNGGNFAAGLAIFCMGLLKKVVLADGVSPYADAIFLGADNGVHPTSAEGWLGALAYTFQLYFDFSGYSDMAVGLSWMFNIQLPYNFNSPYKARSISDFWRRWHISLSTFLRDYLYVPLGGNRRGGVLRYVNLAVTMVLGGLWHGASWSFVLWGALHGCYLMLNHSFRALCVKLGWNHRLDASRAFGVLSWGLTFLLVLVAWVFFRAASIDGALRILQSMAGWVPGPDGIQPLLWNAGLQISSGATWCVVLGLIAVALPNSNRVGEQLHGWCLSSSGARLAVGTSALLVALFLVLVNTARDTTSAFIYFNF